MTATTARTQFLQLTLITLGAVAVYFGFRQLPTGTNLSHMDFQVSGKNAVEFCDPSNPQFIPVVAVRSPVTMSIQAHSATAGHEVRAKLRLATVTGKPMSPADLAVGHTRRLHLLIVDSTLADYSHVHPEPDENPGEWTFAFTPRNGGSYRVFADFIPAATGRGLYAHADLQIAGDAATSRRPFTDTVVRDGLRFKLAPATDPVRAGRTGDLRFSIAREDGGDISLEPVMDAYAHLVAFDRTRGGFAHLHPMETDLAKKPDRQQPSLTFKVTIPESGNYVVWAQVAPGGQEMFVPFQLEVM